MTLRSTAYPQSLRKLILELQKLPTIGEKSAQRLAYHLIISEKNHAKTLSLALLEASEKIGLCKTCAFLAEAEECEYCLDSARDQSLVCVVEKPADVIAIERSAGYQGVYHVLHGLWAPLKGLTPDKIKIKELVARIEHKKNIKEVVLATSTTVEGDATALYLSRLLSELAVKTTRLAQGLPMGGELEYADELTLSHAFQGRKTV
jgi:recombination protein RecR